MRIKKKKICVITSTRAEYGLLRWLMIEIRQLRNLKLQLIVTGTHLSKYFGLTYKEIEKDGFHIDDKVKMLAGNFDKAGLTKAIGRCAINISRAFDRLKPDIIVVLGDRYELLPICSVAVVMNIPIAHISGGDITEGAIDEQIRHAVTKMAHIHFPGTQQSAKRIVQMGENPKMVFPVGELGADSFRNLKNLSKKDLSLEFDLDVNKKWILFTYHPATNISLADNLKVLRNALEVLQETDDIEVVVTYPNADYGTKQIINILKRTSLKYKGKFKLISNLGQSFYLNFMKNSDCMIGNSSSGITESPFARIPAINIGKRQKGRIMHKNVICVAGDKGSIKKAVKKVFSGMFRNKLRHMKNPYNRGRAARNMVKILSKINFVPRLLNKKFFKG